MDGNHNESSPATTTVEKAMPDVLSENELIEHMAKELAWVGFMEDARQSYRAKARAMLQIVRDNDEGK